MRYVRVFLLLALAVSAASASAAEVAVLKSSDSPAWRPAIDALRRAAAAHTVTEYDLRGDRAEADRVVASLKGKAAVLVTVGPLAAQAAQRSGSRDAAGVLHGPGPGPAGPRRRRPT